MFEDANYAGQTVRAIPGFEDSSNDREDPRETRLPPRWLGLTLPSRLCKAHLRTDPWVDPRRRVERAGLIYQLSSKTIKHNDHTHTQTSPSSTAIDTDPGVIHSLVLLAMKSFTFTLALACSSLISTSHARHARSQPQAIQDGAKVDTTSVLDYIKDFFLQRHQNDKRDTQECVYDDYYTILSSYSSATPFCSEFLSIPLSTSIVVATPTTYVSRCPCD